MIRRPRFVNQDGINLVNNCEVMSALNARRKIKLHVVAKVVETKLVVGSVRDVGSIRSLSLEIVHVILDATDFETEEPMNLAHPLGVSGRQIVIHCHNVDAATTGQCI
jgi:hypothetical protein